MATPDDEHSPEETQTRFAVVRPASSPDLTILILDDPSTAARVIAFGGDGRPSKEASADAVAEDELWPAIASVADLTPEEAQQLEGRALVVLGEPECIPGEADGLGIKGGLVIAAAVGYLVVLPIIGVGAIVRWLWL